jgi:competence protein ComEC
MDKVLPDISKNPVIGKFGGRVGNGGNRSPDHKRFKSPLAALAASFALGICGAHYMPGKLAPAGFLVGACACILVGLILLRSGWHRTAVCFALASLAATGVADTRRWEDRFPLNHVRYLESMGADLNDAVRLKGRVISSPYRTGYGLQFDVEAQQTEFLGRVHMVTGKVRLRVQGSEDRETSENGGPLELQYGDVVQTLVRLRRPHIYQNPGSFDFRRWMEDIEDIYWVGTVKNPRLVEKTGHAVGFHFAEIVERVRQRLLRGIDDLYPPWSVQGRYGAVLKAVLWGERTSLDSDTIEDFRKTGLYHLLVIAGLHVGLLTLLLGYVLQFFPWSRMTKSCSVLGFLVVYSFLVQQRAPTLRATLMIALYLVARILDRDHSALNSIGAVALMLLYVRPAWLFETGFQLSFGAALLIVGVVVPILDRTTEPYRRALRRLDDVLLDDSFSPRLAQARLDFRALVTALRHSAGFLERHPALARNLVVAPLRLLVWVANMLLFSGILQMGLLLPMVKTFHRVTFAGIGLNALAIPVMTLLLALALPINLLSVVSPAVAAGPAKLLAAVMALLFNMTHLPKLAPWLSYRMPEPPLWVVWGFCGAFAFAGLTLRYSWRASGSGRAPLGPTYARGAAGASLAACAVFVVLVALHPFAPRLPSGVLRLTVLDCGHGDAAFLLFPDGTTMLVDAGGGHTRGAREGGFQGRRWDPGEDIVSPFLWSQGMKKIDVVALTRAHEDHFGGLGAIFNNFRVGEFWHAPGPETPEYAALLDKVAELAIPTRTLMAGDTLAIGDTSIHVLWPSGDPPSEGLSANDDSLVMRISAGGQSFMLPGDASRKVEQQLLVSGEPLKSAVLKVAHRGSKSSSSEEFIARVVPSVAIISTEAGGMANLPSPGTLEVLRNAGARVFETGIDGAITVDWKDGSLNVSTYAASTAKQPRATEPARKVTAHIAKVQRGPAAGR